MSDYDLINGEILTVTVTVDEETVIANINTAARGPAGTGGGGTNSVTSATTSDGTADLSLANVTTATATVTGTLTAPHIHGNLAGSVYAHIRAGENLAKGDPVYVSGSHGSGSTLIPIVSKADASNAAKMPAIGIMDAAVLANANGHMVITGTITELNTAGLTVNAELYVAAGGGMTATPPTARAQPVARVERANANNGAVIVKVNGLSASDATANTLVRRTSGGGASFAGIALSGITTNSGSYSQVGGTNFNVATTTSANLTATGSGTVTVSGEGGTTISGGTLTFSPAAFAYGTGAASAHRIALGAGTTGAELFGAATAAAARTTLMGEILKYDPNDAATRTNPAAYADDDTLAGINLTVGMWEISWYAAFNTGCGVNGRLLLGTSANVDILSTGLFGVGFRGTVQTNVAYVSATGELTLGNTPGTLGNWALTGNVIIKITGNTTLALQYFRNSNVGGATIIRRAGAFLRARKIN